MYQQVINTVIATSFKTARCNKKQLDLTLQNTIMRFNNTPPASRQISAPRGVTRFWGREKSAIKSARVGYESISQKQSQ
jgi:hypothetical protein